MQIWRTEKKLKNAFNGNLESFSENTDPLVSIASFNYVFSEFYFLLFLEEG